MGLQIPNLDDRRFQDLVDEARRLIPRYCPRWTDHNLSDPGITLLELIAGMVETLIYRLNRVPDKSYITFMDLMGLRLQPPTAARVGLTFWLSGPLMTEAQPVTIPADTEVSTVRGAAGFSVSFSTDTDRVCIAPHPLACVASYADGSFRAISDILRDDNPDPLAVFSEKPIEGDSFILVDAGDLSGHVLELIFSGPIQGFGIDPKQPPRVWEAWCSDEWRPADIELDDTGGLNKEGRVILHLPQRMTQRECNGHTGYLVRCRYVRSFAKQKLYGDSPQIQNLRLASLGITIESTHSTTIFGEIVGRSSGEPGQIFHLENTPVLPRRPGERIEILERDTWEPWIERDDFAATRPSDTHYTLDSVSGEICFGPRIREPDGSECQYGAIPPVSSLIRMARYRTGGGISGNVGKSTLTVLKTALSNVDHVSNRAEAAGGLDAENLDRARLRAPQMLRTSDRAVTAEDYEYLALTAGKGIRRAKCMQPGAVGAQGRPPTGSLRLLLVPAIEPANCGVTRKRLSLSERGSMTDEVRDYIDKRRLLTAVFEIGEPTYVQVSVEARIKARPNVDRSAVARDARERLEAFLNPLVGGPDGAGWPFGRSLYISEVYAILQATPGVEYLEQVVLRLDDPTPTAQPVVEVPADGLIISGEHQITML